MEMDRLRAMIFKRQDPVDSLSPFLIAFPIQSAVQPVYPVTKLLVCCFRVRRHPEDVSPSRPGWLKPRIPPGRYTVAFDSFRTEKFYKNGKASKLVLNFQVIDIGEFFETPLQRYYQVAEIGEKPGKGGSFKAKGQTSDFMREYVYCFNYVPKRRDRIPMEVWQRHGYKVKVKDVKYNANQDKMPELLCYSVIDKIIGVTD